jgi:hypothetical protein
MESLDGLIEGSVTDLIGRETWVGDGQEIDISELLDAVERIKATLLQRLAATPPFDLDDDQFEGAMSGTLHRALRTYDTEVLDDPGFWAYVASGPLWQFVKWREDPSQRKREVYHRYIDGLTVECVPLRMFLRAQAVVDGDDYSLAAAIEKGVDFWRSHVLRVKTGAKPELARAVVKEQQGARMTVGPVREYAKRINRRWSNELFYLLNDHDCEIVAESERPD